MKHVCCALALLICIGLPSQTEAGIDIDFGAQVRIGDDADLFLSISSRYFDRDRSSVDRAAALYRNPDDLAVALYLAKRAEVRVDRVHRLRRGGLSWWQVSVELGLPADIWFVRVQRDPGPPYGKAYGHWKHHKKDRRRAIALTDVQARDLVAVRMIHEYYGVSVAVAMEWRADGDGVRRLMTSEYRSRHSNAKANRRAAVKSKGKGKPKR